MKAVRHPSKFKLHKETTKSVLRAIVEKELATWAAAGLTAWRMTSGISAVSDKK
jgi:hypothetical protein